MGAAAENRPQKGWKPPGEAPAGNRITKWMLARRRLRCLSPSSSLEGHPLAPSDGPGNCRRRSALVQVGHPADIGGRRHSFVTGQAPPCSMEVEYQGSRGVCLPTRPNCPQHRTIHDRGRNGRGCGGATLVHGLLPHTAAGGQGSTWEEMGMAHEGGTWK